MSCGLKKQQQNNEGGVHLTERTCSPYNPIIKQIVDDCLGLPIYPVSSIDAVIDEDGNTLRKILEDLINNIKSGSYSVTQIEEEISNIWNIVHNLNENYTTADDFDDFKNAILPLLCRISSMNSVTTGNIEDTHNYDTDSNDPNTPMIVSVVKKLKNDIDSLLGNNPGGDIPSISSLQTLINNLSDLVYAVANYNTDPLNDSGLSYKNGNQNLLQIVYEIEQLKKELGPGTDENDTLSNKVANLTKMVYGIAKCAADSNDKNGIYDNADDQTTHIVDLVNKIVELLGPMEGNTIYNYITNLLGDSVNLSGYAHLDPEVLEQMPETVNEQTAVHYKTLKISEYPVTTAEFVRTTGFKDEVVYYGFVEEHICDTPNPYPFGHTEDNVGWPLYWRTLRPKSENHGQDWDLNDPDSYNYTAIITPSGKLLKMGDNTIGGADFTQTIEFILQDDKSPKFETDALTNLPNDITVKDICYMYNDNYYRVGDFNGDREVNTPDVNKLIEIYLRSLPVSQTISYPTPYHPKKSVGWIFYNRDNDHIIAYPCIQGKLYIDSLTGKVYRYKSGRMYEVAKLDFEAGKGISISKDLQYELPNEDNPMLGEGAYTKYTIEIDSHNLNSVIDVSSEDAFLPLSATLSGPKYAITLKLDLNKCLYCYGDKDNNNLYKPLYDEKYETGTYFIVETPYDVVGIPESTTFVYDPLLDALPPLVYLWERHRDSHYDGSNKYHVGQSGDYYVFNTSVNINSLPSYNINDVTALIDFLLIGNNASISAYHRNEFLALKAELILKKDSGTYSTTQEAILQDVINAITSELNAPISLSQNSNNLLKKYVYVLKSDNTLDIVAVDSDFYWNRAKAASLDFDGSGSTNISDVTTLIDGLLLGDPLDIVISYNIVLGALMYKLTSPNTLDQVTVDKTEYKGAYGKIFAVSYEKPEYHVSDTWYYFDYQKYLRPLIPLYTIGYDDTKKDLYLYGDRLIISATKLGGASLNQSSILNSDNIIRNLGNNSTPYLFGSAPFDYNIIGNEVEIPDKCYLDRTGSFNPSNGDTLFTLTEANLFELYEDYFLHLYLDENSQGVVDPSLPDTIPALMGTGNCDEISIINDLSEYSLLSKSYAAPYKFDLAEKVKYLIAERIKQLILAFSGDVADPTEIIIQIFNTPTEGLISSYYCLDCHHSTFGDSFINRCLLYKVREEIHIWVDETTIQLIDWSNFEMTNLIDILRIDASITLLERSNIQENVIYYFPKFGLQLKFKKELMAIDNSTIIGVVTPVVVLVESEQNLLKYDEKRELDFSFRNVYSGSLIKPHGAIVDVKPNEYLNLGVVDYCIFDFSKFTEIPGNEVINVSGRFTANIDSMPIELFPSSVPSNTGNEGAPRLLTRSASIAMTTSKPIRFAETCPNTLLGHTYEYHMLDGIFSYVDVTPTKAVQVIDEGA